MTQRGTGRLLAAIVMTFAGSVGALFTGSIEIALLVAPWTVVLVLGLGSRDAADPRVVIEATPARVVVGDEVAVTATVDGIAGTVQAAIRHTRGRPQTPLATAAHSGRAVLRWPIDDLPWGTHDVGHLDIEIVEPYGLVRWRGRVDQPTPVRVHPTPSRLRELLTPHRVRRTIGNHASAAIGRGVEYADLRQYQPGDAVRDINWRVSARSQELWVSERHSDRAADVVLLLDSFIDEGADGPRFFAQSVEATMTIAEQHIAATDRVGLVELGGIVRWVDARPGRHQLHRIVDALLATTQYDNAADKDLTIIPPRALPPRSFVIALSPLTDRRFVDALFVMAARGHDIAVIETPPAGADVDDVTAEMRAGRRLWEAERRVLRDRLTTSGVATAQWRRGDHVELALAELRRHRAQVRPVGVR